jgi:hypothetical protein
MKPAGEQGEDQAGGPPAHPEPVHEQNRRAGHEREQPGERERPGPGVRVEPRVPQDREVLGQDRDRGPGVRRIADDAGRRPRSCTSPGTAGSRTRSVRRSGRAGCASAWAARARDRFWLGIPRTRDGVRPISNIGAGRACFSTTQARGVGSLIVSIGDRWRREDGRWGPGDHDHQPPRARREPSASESVPEGIYSLPRPTFTNRVGLPSGTDSHWLGSRFRAVPPAVPGGLVQLVLPRRRPRRHNHDRECLSGRRGRALTRLD